MEKEFLEAAVPLPRRVCGVLLQEFTIGHALLLQRLGSPFLCGGGIPHLGDLALAMAVCSQRVETAMAMVRGERGAWRLKWWGWQLRVWSILQPGRWLLGVISFREYVETGKQAPDMYHEAGGRPLKIPVLLGMVTVLMVRLGKTEKEALETPYGMALWQIGAVRALEGKAEFSDPEDEALGGGE